MKVVSTTDPIYDIIIIMQSRILKSKMTVLSSEWPFPTLLDVAAEKKDFSVTNIDINALLYAVSDWLR